MKKWVRMGLVSALIFVLALATVGAQGPPGAGWWTSFAIQNVGDAAGTVTITAYRGSDGTAGTTYSTSETIPLGGALSYHPGLAADPAQNRIDFDTPLPSGFIGSVVVQSSVAIVATGEVGNNQQGSVGTAGGLAKAQYQAIGGTQVANTIRFPVVKNNYAGQTTTFYIQAAGADASITASFKMDNGQTYSKNYTIKANYMVAVAPSDAGVPSGKAAGGGSFGALTVTSSSGPIAGVVCEHQHSASPGTLILSTRGFTPDDLGTTLYAPVIKHLFANKATTGLTVQNAGTSATWIKAVFTVYNTVAPASPSLIGKTYTKEFTNVAPGAQVTFRGENTNTIGGMPAGTLASAVITSGGNIVATVNEANSKGKATYSCFNSANASTTVALPLVKEDFYGMTNGVIVQNVGTAQTTVHVEYNSGTKTYILQKALAVGEAYSFYDASSTKYTPVSGSSRPVNNAKYAVTVISQGGANIVAIAQEADVNAADGTLDLKNYEGFNLQ